MIQFYAPNLRETLTLGPEESGHAIRVLRKKRGDLIAVTDGKGTRFSCRIEDPNPRGVKISIEGEEEISKNWKGIITVAVAPTKNADRMAWLVEKCTEIGIDRIVFLNCRHSERKHINIERLRRNAISAMNQSLKTVLPEIEGPVDPAKLVERGQKYLGYCDRGIERKEFAKEYIAGEDVTLAIGPEGDFSPEEVETMMKNGFKPVSFGDERLRTETAALYGVTAVHVIEQLHKPC